MQASFLPVRVLREVDSTFDGADLKRIAQGEDGFDYAMKRIQEHPYLPLCEWVSYHLCRAVGIQTPDFAVLDCGDMLPPAFGSRIEYTKQIDKNPSSFTVTGFFLPFKESLSPVYTLDAFLPNGDRHGRNMMLRVTPGGQTLLAFDFSRAWIISGLPFGDMASLAPECHTAKWWAAFKIFCQIEKSTETLDRLCNLPDNWLENCVKNTPEAWRKDIEWDATCHFWSTRRRERADQALAWL
jgi:hypothetical protein